MSRAIAILRLEYRHRLSLISESQAEIRKARLLEDEEAIADITAAKRALDEEVKDILDAISILTSHYPAPPSPQAISERAARLKRMMKHSRSVRR